MQNGSNANVLWEIRDVKASEKLFIYDPHGNKVITCVRNNCWPDETLDKFQAAGDYNTTFGFTLTNCDIHDAGTYHLQQGSSNSIGVLFIFGKHKLLENMHVILSSLLEKLP